MLTALSQWVVENSWLGLCSLLNGDKTIDSGSKGCPEQKISRVPLLHFWAEIFKGKNKMAARYFKVKYDFYTNEARN